MSWLLAASRYEEIRMEVADFIEDFGITAYPFDMFELLERLHVSVKAYSELPDQSRDIFLDINPDGFTSFSLDHNPHNTTIYYNDIDRPLTRVRFTLAHELGHLVLGHPDDWDDDFETEADNFANYLLAPAPLVVRMAFKSSESIASVFHLSLDCSRVVLDRTLNRLRYGSRNLTEYEKRILHACFKGEVGDGIL